MPSSGTDEVGRLGKSFNTMMETVQEREQGLRRVTLFQRTLLDNAAYCITSTTPDGVVSSFNPAAECLLGYAAAEVVGMKTPCSGTIRMRWRSVPGNCPGRCHQRAQRGRRARNSGSSCK